MIRVALCKEEKVLEQDIAWDQFLEKYRFQSGLVWIDMDQPDENEWKKLCEYFELSKSTILTSKHYTEYPLIEEYNDYLFIATHIYDLNHVNMTSKKKELDIVIGNNYLITVHRGEMSLINKIRETLTKASYYFKTDPAMLAIYILLEHLNVFSHVVNMLENRIEDLEKFILTGESEDITDRIIGFRGFCNELKRNIRPLCDQYRHLSLFDNNKLTEKATRSIKILEDRCFAVRENVDILRDTLNSLQDSYLTVVSNKMNELSFNMNEVIHQLTLVSTIFLPLTFITGWFGMNFRNMPLLNSTFGYPITILATIIIVIVLNRLFRKRGWYFSNGKKK